MEASGTSKTAFPVQIILKYHNLYIQRTPLFPQRGTRNSCLFKQRSFLIWQYSFSSSIHHAYRATDTRIALHHPHIRYSRCLSRRTQSNRNFCDIDQQKLPETRLGLCMARCTKHTLFDPAFPSPIVESEDHPLHSEPCIFVTESLAVAGQCKRSIHFTQEQLTMEQYFVRNLVPSDWQRSDYYARRVVRLRIPPMADTVPRPDLRSGRLPTAEQVFILKYSVSCPVGAPLVSQPFESSLSSRTIL